MKKSTFWKLMLMILPIAAVVLATTPDSVIVFDAQTGTSAAYSYFELMEDVGTLQMATPLAGILSGLSGILAAVYLGAKKSWGLSGAVWAAFLASVFAVLPVMMRTGDLIVVPNVLLPILMLAEAILAQVIKKKPQEEAQKAPRLSVH